MENNHYILDSVNRPQTRNYVQVCLTICTQTICKPVNSILISRVVRLYNFIS